MVPEKQADFADIIPFFCCIPLLFCGGLWGDLALRMLAFALCAMPLHFFLLSGRATCLCTASFLGLGAYAAALTAGGRSSFSAMSAAFFAAVAVPLLAALILGVFLCRLEGDLFSLATFCLAEAMRVLLEGCPFTGGARGFDNIAFRPSPFAAGLFFALALLFFTLLQKSAFGLLARCCAVSPEGAAGCGISIPTVRLFSFCAMAFFCGGAGFFFAGMEGYLLPADFSFQTGCVLLSAALLAGQGHLKAAAVFACLLALSEIYLSAFLSFRLLLMAVLFLAAAFGLLDGFSAKRRENHGTADFGGPKALCFLRRCAGRLPGFLHPAHRQSGAGRSQRSRKDHAL